MLHSLISKWGCTGFDGECGRLVGVSRLIGKGGKVDQKLNAESNHYAYAMAA